MARERAGFGECDERAVVLGQSEELLAEDLPETVLESVIDGKMSQAGAL